MKHATLLTHFSSYSKMFHSVAAEEPNNLCPYLTVLFLFGTSDVVEADLSGLGCWYQFSDLHWYDGDDVCVAL